MAKGRQKWSRTVGLSGDRTRELIERTRLTAFLDDSNRITDLGANSTCHESGACAAGGAAPSGATRELCAREFFEGGFYGLRSALD